jgi:hypothetical protein
MAHQGAEHHRKAAEHHKKAAEHHEHAAKHYEDGHHENPAAGGLAAQPRPR